MVKARKFRPYEEAKEFVHKLRLESQPEWYRYCKSGKKPVGIPTHPDRTYKDNGWIRWGDWLGFHMTIQDKRTLTDSVIDGSLPKKDSTITFALKEQAEAATREWLQRLEDRELSGR